MKLFTNHSFILSLCYVLADDPSSNPSSNLSSNLSSNPLAQSPRPIPSPNPSPNALRSILDNIIFLHKIPSWFGQQKKLPLGCHSIKLSLELQTYDYPEKIIKNHLQELARKEANSWNSKNLQNDYKAMFNLYNLYLKQCNWPNRSQSIIQDLLKHSDLANIKTDLQLPNNFQEIESKISNLLWKNPRRLIPNPSFQEFVNTLCLIIAESVSTSTKKLYSKSYDQIMNWRFPVEFKTMADDLYQHLINEYLNFLKTNQDFWLKIKNSISMTQQNLPQENFQQRI